MAMLNNQMASSAIISHGTSWDHFPRQNGAMVAEKPNGIARGAGFVAAQLRAIASQLCWGEFSTMSVANCDFWIL